MSFCVFCWNSFRAMAAWSDRHLNRADSLTRFAIGRWPKLPSFPHLLIVYPDASGGSPMVA